MMAPGLLVTRYCAAWNEPDATRRHQILEGVMEPDAVYVDPGVEVKGLMALVVHIGFAAARHPGSRIVATTEVDSHHGLLRFGWRRERADGGVIAGGIDIAELSAGGKLQRVIGFLDSPSALCSSPFSGGEESEI